MVSVTGGSSIDFRVLGSVSLTGPEGNQLHSILARPKLVALLSRLACREPGAFVRRDTLIALLWPALDQDRGRSALRQSLYHLRRSLGDAAILSRGDEEVAVDPEVVGCDVSSMRAAIAGGDTEAGLELYRGDFLDGFYLHGVPGFEDWAERLRTELRLEAAEAAIRLAEQLAADGSPSAGQWAVRCAQLAPLDEARVRRTIAALISVDDRVGAVREFEAFADRLAHELDLEPGSETRSLIADLRVEAAGRPPRADAPDAAEGAAPGHLPPSPPSSRAKPGVGWPRAFRLGLVVGALGVLSVFVVQAFRKSVAPAERSRVLVAGFVNSTGDPTLDATARMTADWITRGLAETGLVDVVVPPGEGPDPNSADAEERAFRLAESARAGVVVSGTLYRLGDSLQIETRIVDMGRRQHLATIDPVRAALADPLPAMEETRQRVAGALAVTLDGRIAAFADAARDPPRYSAYQAFIDGETEYNRAFDRSGTASFLDARDHFLRAFELDTTFKAPLLRAAWSSYAGFRAEAADSLAQVVLPHRESLTPHARARLDMLIGMLRGDRLAALRAARLLTSAPLDRPLRAIDANRPAEARDALREAGEYARGVAEFGYYGIEVFYWQLLANAQHMLGQHDAELENIRKGRERYPNEVLLAAVELRALAALGRFAELDRMVDVGATLPAARTPSFGGGIWRAAGELDAHGYHAEALALAERAVDWYDDLPADERGSAGALNGMAKSYYVARRWEAADSVFREREALWPGDYNALGYRAVIAARLGDREAAERLLARVRELANPYDHGRPAYWEACVAAQLGDLERGITQLLDAYREGRAYDLLLHADLDLEPLRPDPRFQELLRPKG
jgi:DNA-binding SARP family transcriptional activator/TolB-like protein